MWRLQIVLVPPSAQDTIPLLDANVNMSDTSQLAFPVLQYNEDISNDNNGNSNCNSSHRRIYSSAGSDTLNYLPNCKKFLHFTNGSKTLLQLSNEILTKFGKLYPNFNQPIEIISLQDKHGCDLDSQFIIKDVFENDSVVLVILKDEIDWSGNQHVSLLQLARQRKRINNKSSTKSLTTERTNKDRNEDILPINKDSMHFTVRNSIMKNFINKSRVSTPLMNEILPVENKCDTPDGMKVSIRPSPVVNASNSHKHINGGTVIYEDDDNKENRPSSNAQQKISNTKLAGTKVSNEPYNSSEDPDFEPTDDNSPQISYDSIDTDFQLSNTSSTNSDMHMQHFAPSGMVQSPPRKSSLEIRVQNKKSDDLPSNDKNMSESYRRIETFSDEEDFNEIENNNGDSFVNNSKRASAGFRDIDSDLDNVSFTSDIKDAVQSTQNTKNALSPSSFSLHANNRLNRNQYKEDLFHFVENEFPDKSPGNTSTKFHGKGVKIQDTIRILNRSKPIKETKVPRNNHVTESRFRNFVPTMKAKSKSHASEEAGPYTKDTNNINGVISSTKNTTVGKIKVKRKIGDAEAKVREFKKKRNMGNKSLKDIFSNAGKMITGNSSIKVVKLTRDPVDDSKEKMKTNSISGSRAQDSDNMPTNKSAPAERANSEAIPFGIERTHSTTNIQQLKRVKLTRSSSSSSAESSSESSSSDDLEDTSGSRNVQIKKISPRASHEPALDSSKRPVADRDDARMKRYQTPEYVNSDEDDK